MDFQTAVRTCLSKYVGFDGRASRSEYWWFFLASFLATTVGTVIDMILGVGLIGNLFALGLFLPGLAAAVRRLHDTDRSGWFILIGLIPVIGLVIIYFLAQPTKPGPNRFGPAPVA